MFASVPSAVLFGAQGHPVTVEVHVGKGIPGFHVVGLPDESVREARDRARAAVLSSGLDWPSIKITVNLAPSPERKSGSGLDLAIAIGVLAAAGHVPTDSFERLAFLGELGLDGSIRAIPGVAPMVGVLRTHDLVVPVGNTREACVVAQGSVHPVGHLRDLVAVLAEGAPWPDHDDPGAGLPEAAPPDLADVAGQPLARLALEIAAAGRHHLLFVGPPGSGKTMLAARLPGILPALAPEAALETTMVHSAAGVALPPSGLVTTPPFRAPHHTSSEVALVGGGSSSLRPGEVSLAHHGVLFLDELPEFASRVMDTLRQPLEDGNVRVSRAALHATIPARFQLVAAMNPCPCGEGNVPGACECAEGRVRKYVGRVSGPLLDRFDLRVSVERPTVEHLLGPERGESSADVADRVGRAQARALRRQGCLNGELHPNALDACAELSPSAFMALRTALEKGALSARGYHRIRRVARTIADLADEPADLIDEATVCLALEMRTTIRRSSGVFGAVA